ncbi:MAG TPA: hypothetical protein VIX73_08515, partial [Kofleriaceae bacterium]
MPERQSRETQDDPPACDSLEALRDVIRDEATERTWNQGVSLARDRRAVGRRSAAVGELALEVRVPGRPAPFEVILTPARGEWECSCDGRDAVCSHVVAAVLSAIDAARTGGDVPDEAARGLATLRYLLAPA